LNSKKRHCVVIGAGIVGSSCAWRLLRDGHEVTIVDPVLPGQSTSFGNAGCISPSAVIPFSYPGVARQVPRWLLDRAGPLWIRWAHLPNVLPWLWRFWRAGSMEQVEAIAQAQHHLMSEVRADYDQILSETGSDWLREKRGLIMLYDNEQRFKADAWQFDLRERLGQKLTRLSAEELRDLEPALADHPGADDQVALYDPTWQHLLDPGEVTRNIAEAAFAAGANWLQERITSLSRTGEGWRLRTTAGQSLEADEVVIAAGVWSRELAAQLGTRVPLAAKRGYHIMVHEPSAQLSHPVMSMSRMFVLTPMRLGLRLAGTAEFAAIDTSPDYRRAEVLLEHARHYVPDLEGDSYSQWMGQRPMMPDSKPVIGPVPGQRGAWCAFGHGHYGLTQGPTTGRIITDLIAGRDPHLDLTPFSAERF
jgi:D-amino-acid dehydrogenase